MLILDEVDVILENTTRDKKNYPTMMKCSIYQVHKNPKCLYAQYQSFKTHEAKTNKTKTNRQNHRFGTSQYLHFDN